MFRKMKKLIMVILLVVKRNEDRYYRELYVQQQEGIFKVAESQNVEETFL